MYYSAPCCDRALGRPCMTHHTSAQHHEFTDQSMIGRPITPSDLGLICLQLVSRAQCIACHNYTTLLTLK